MSDFRAPTQSVTKQFNCVDIWRPREFHSIELQHGSEVTVEYPRHWHDEFYLSATLAGASYLDCSGTSFSVPPGQLAIVPPGEVHANRKLGCTSRTVFLEFKALRDTVERFVEQSTPRLDFRPGLIDDKRTVKDFLQLHRSLEGPGSNWSRKILYCSFSVSW